MLYLFDLDGTLISGYMDRRDKDFTVWEVLPGRREYLAELLARGNTIAIVTNQGGVAFGHVTADAARGKLFAAAHALGLGNKVRIVQGTPAPFIDPPETPLTIYTCFHDMRGQAPYNDPAWAARRKPSGAMIREAVREHPRAAAFGVLYVGDRPEDEAAAHDAQVAFQWAHIFFKDTGE